MSSLSIQSQTTEQFRRLFADLPPDVQKQTRIAYRQFKQNPNHPSLKFKKFMQHCRFIQHGSAKTIALLGNW